MFIEIRGCGRNWLKLSQSLELLILLKMLRGDLPQFLWGQEIGVFFKPRALIFAGQRENPTRELKKKLNLT